MIDPVRCQAHRTAILAAGEIAWTQRSERSYVRCTNRPTAVATEITPSGTEARAMSLCEVCRLAMVRQHGDGFARFTPMVPDNEIRRQPRFFVRPAEDRTKGRKRHHEIADRMQLDNEGEPISVSAPMSRSAARELNVELNSAWIAKGWDTVDQLLTELKQECA